MSIGVALLAFVAGNSDAHSGTCRQQANPPAQAAGNKAALASAEGERGKKLVLKDGSFQLAREYQRKGERVRYFSTERGDWEEIPAAMVDWDATAKAEAASAAKEKELLQKVHHEEEQRQKEMPLEVDASLPVAPGIFLPPGEGLFVVEGKSVTQLDQVGAEIRTDKKQLLKQVLSPVPVVPSKKNVEIAGAKAVRRINSERPEFYLREAPPDPDRVSSIRASSRAGDNGPDVELVKLTVKGGKREIESIKSLFGQQIGEDRNSIGIQRWDIAQNVFRFTLAESLPAGEYAFAQVLPDGLNLYVWDFGVDRKSGDSAKSAPPVKK
ncbi:MAG TPA: hypothetical protein VLC94_05130 [Candidatus Acidoferrum sp.]|nr:hypothetical protein [Candidatus Acidoferrum sp.]